MAFIVKRDPIVIPAGIPVASTSQIFVTSSNSNITSEIYVKTSIYTFSALYTYLEWGGHGWYFLDDTFSVIAVALGGSADTIPTSGYTIYIGGGSITVAAA